MQATGNGHIARANAMARALSGFDSIEVTWLYSGRPESELFGVGENYQWRRGMTFATDGGRINLLRTVTTNNVVQFVRDVYRLDLSAWDLVICDFEPVIAWAARLQGVPTLGIGHQYAFQYDVPYEGGNLLSNLFLQKFAPVTQGLGLHWHHFNQAILPPIADLDGQSRQPAKQGKYVVYLPFEDQQFVLSLLRQIRGATFYVYGPGLSRFDSEGHIQTRPLSRVGFKQDLVDAEGVICNTGFELISECLLMGTKVLTKPLAGQVEQISNAAALRQLGYATVLDRWSPEPIRDWIRDGVNVQVSYPKVHERIARWIVEGQRESVAELAGQLWSSVHEVRNSDRTAADAGDWTGRRAG